MSVKPMTSIFESLYAAIPEAIRQQSGKVFYAGRDAFNQPSALYVMGVNPGGDPLALPSHTLSRHSEWVRTEAPANWCAYRDEAWDGRPVGRRGLQPRMLHLYQRLGFDPGAVPASNLIFVRTRRAHHLGQQLPLLAEQCWGFHQRFIALAQPRVILCMGQTVGHYVRRQLQADQFCDEFIERNQRRWRSTRYRTAEGTSVVVASHPSIADWCNPNTDPSALVIQALQESTAARLQSGRDSG